MIVYQLSFTRDDMDGDWAKIYYATLREAKAHANNLCADQENYGLFGYIDRIEIAPAPKLQLVLNLLNDEPGRHPFASRLRKLDFELSTEQSDAEREEELKDHYQQEAR